MRAGILILGAALLAAGQAPQFETFERCIACHNGLTTAEGEDISFGFAWRASMMANAARDPYWQASVRREVMDHPGAREAIEDKCATCHMPMARFMAKQAGRKGRIFDLLPFDPENEESRLAADGVSCALCHRISSAPGTRESFTGGFTIDTMDRQVFGPFAVDAGRTRVMQSSSGFRPEEAKHIARSELCATCHTLYTTALGPKGEALGELPEQVPYLEWLHSSYRETKSCQDCHMPVVRGKTAISSVLGQAREEVSRHTFLGGNFFIPRMLNRFRSELAPAATPAELEAGAARTVAHLQADATRLAIESLALRGAQLEADIALENLAGHKLPTGYPARRAWLHVTVRDGQGRIIFESGAFTPEGAVRGDDHDAGEGSFEPHYTEIREPGQVQIYESIMGDSQGRPTTGLLHGVRYLKDNRLLPRGFDKATANKDVAVAGGAAADIDFTGGGDRIRYSVALGEAQGPFHVEAALWYQPIGFRWAANLRAYDAAEPRRFTRYYNAMAAGSAVMLTRARAVYPPRM